MQVGLVSDIHGNKPALEAVFADMPPVDAVVCAGDVVGYNPWHGDCVEAVRDRSVPTVAGNHDRAVADGEGFAFTSAAGAGVRHARETLTDDQLDWLAGLPAERRALGGRLKLIHGHPGDPDRYTFPEQFGGHLLGDEDALVLGHTHIQHHERFEDGVVVNPGSVGQPRDGDPRAAYAVLDLADLTSPNTASSTTSTGSSGPSRRRACPRTWASGCARGGRRFATTAPQSMSCRQSSAASRSSQGTKTAMELAEVMTS